MTETPHYLTTEDPVDERLVVDEELGVVVDPYQGPSADPTGPDPIDIRPGDWESGR